MKHKGGGGGSNIKKVGMFVENFEIDPKGRPIWAWLTHFLTSKSDLSGGGYSILCCISLRATLSKTLKAKNIGDFFSTPKVRPKAEIYTPKRDHEHPHIF